MGSLLCLTLPVLGCSPSADRTSSAGPEVSAEPSASASATAIAGPPAPLTGVATTAAVAARPAVAVPVLLGKGVPTGLGSADIVYAEWDGGSGIRLLALYQSQDNASVGPVAGLTSSDAKLLPVVKPVLAAGQTFAKFSKIASTAGLNVVSSSKPGAAFRSSGGATYASTAALRAYAPRGSTPPPNLFPLAIGDAPLANSGVHPVTALKVPSAANPLFSWSWDAKTKRWRASIGGAAVSAANVVVLPMPYKRVLVENKGAAVMTADIFGTGNAYVVSGAHGAAGRWARNGPLKVTTVATPDGVAMGFAPGPTWVILVPVGNAWAVA